MSAVRDAKRGPGRSIRALAGRGALPFAALLLAGGCRPPPEIVPCATESECAAAQRCDERLGRCVRDEAPCNVAPVADACRCVEDGDCQSGACGPGLFGPTCIPSEPPLGGTIELGAFTTSAAAGTGPVTFTLPAGSTAFTLVAESPGELYCLMPRTLVDPLGSVWFDRTYASAPLVQPWPGYPVLTVLVPDNDFTAPPPAGDWTVVVDTYDCGPPGAPTVDTTILGSVGWGGAVPVAGTVDRLAVIPKEAAGGTLHLNVHLTPAVGVDAAAAPVNEFVAGFLTRFWTIYGQDGGAGYVPGVVTYYDAPAEFSTIESYEEQYRACATLSEPAPDGGPAVNLIVVGGFAEELEGALGIAAGIPGSMVHDHVYQACVEMEAYPLSTDIMGTLVAHEVGHFLGLRHTSEIGIGLFDAISDTPECPPQFWSDPQFCPDFENPMFPISNPESAVRGFFTAGQRLVLSGVPTLR